MSLRRRTHASPAVSLVVVSNGRSAFLRGRTTIGLTGEILIIAITTIVPESTGVEYFAADAAFLLSPSSERVLDAKTVPASGQAGTVFASDIVHFWHVARDGGDMTWYVVYKGKVPGVYNDWEECRRQVHRFSGNSYKGYTTRAEAEDRYARYLAGERTERRRNRMKTTFIGTVIVVTLALFYVMLV
ncbi:hypothetical protein QYE76_041141 [Lolium multiflorum]|uniref:Ribonuclease H n=1 Tax=Lolium multiflorum TaxID=4521 RepID=A0AAD8TE57_LOLMU|nr:hypothetical protein QYE76_041141 [Lolium multiflorum]